MPRSRCGFRKRTWITISGGEPFDQPEALVALLAQVHLLSECSILVYSGYPFETLLDKHPQVLAAIDVLISRAVRRDPTAEGLA